ncbi:MAG: hypothetical protein ACKV2Q_30840 [Planctomycetaceae bacterium]
MFLNARGTYKMVYDETPWYSAMAFYGFDVSRCPVNRLYELAMQLCGEAEQQPVFLNGRSNGKRGWFLPFESGHRRLAKHGLEQIEAFWIVCSDVVNVAVNPFAPAAFEYSPNFDPVYNQVRSKVVFCTLKSDPVWLESVARRICDLIDPMYGYCFRNSTIPDPRGYASGGDHRLHLDDLPPREMWLDTYRYGIYALGYFRGVYESSFLSPAHLEQTVDGVPFDHWVAGDSRRGVLSPFTDRLTLWELESEAIPEVREELHAAQLLLWKDNKRARDIRKILFQAEVERQAKRKPNRQKLLALLRTLEERYGEEGAESPVVTIDEFFPGNTVDQSIAANLSPHPGLKVFRDVLKRIRGKETVQDVLIVIGDSPMLPETDDGDFEDDDWPYSDEVYVLTSSSPAEVEKWTAKLQPDTVSLTHWRNNQPPKGAPDLQPGMQLIRLWWD